MKCYRGLLFTFLTASLLSCGSEKQSSQSYPTTDEPTPQQSLSHYMDRFMRALMNNSGATAILLAVAKDGKIQYEKAYGFQDADQTTELRQDALMRTASIVKPVTAAAMHELARSGVLALSDHVFCNGNNAPCWLASDLLPQGADPRAGDITILQLIEHSGGWYLESGSGITQEVEIRETLGLTGPPTREDIVQFFMQRPLDFTPGAPDSSRVLYSNFGYLLLGMIIEQASQTTYTQYVQTAIMAPLGISSLDFDAAESKREDRDTREPNYISDQMCPSIYTVGEEALCSEEGFESRNWVAVGQSLSTAGTMALFAQAYKLPGFLERDSSGEPLLPEETFDGYQNGAAYGTTSFVRQLPNGVSYAILMNRDFDLGPIVYGMDSRLLSFRGYDK